MLKIVENLWAVGAPPRILPGSSQLVGSGCWPLPRTTPPLSVFGPLVLPPPNEQSWARPCNAVWKLESSWSLEEHAAQRSQTSADSLVVHLPAERVAARWTEHDPRRRLHAVSTSTRLVAHLRAKQAASNDISLTSNPVVATAYLSLTPSKTMYL